ncbi:MAG: hypothetical protein NTY19_42985 [Planctomycetota bacterium]|nr:hypothetical protein [Planctomycetota bacterium]
MKTILDQIDVLNKIVSDMGRMIPRKEDIREALPPAIIDQIGEIIRRYAEEIELLKSVRQAGVTGIFKRRERAIQAFARAIDEESKEIMVIGSSLKGLFQKEEYQSIAEKLRFKSDRGLVHVKFLLTHPIVADFRARQENRGFTEIGHEIILTLETLKHWNAEYCHVKLYLGTPTCFAIKTTRNMLINPYPYISVSYDSPCLVLENTPDGGSERPGYFFDEFSSRHFGAWDSELAVRICSVATVDARIRDYDKVIATCRSSLKDYATAVENILDRGKQIH